MSRSRDACRALFLLLACCALQAAALSRSVGDTKSKAATPENLEALKQKKKPGGGGAAIKNIAGDTKSTAKKNTAPNPAADAQTATKPSASTTATPIDRRGSVIGPSSIRLTVDPLTEESISGGTARGAISGRAVADSKKSSIRFHGDLWRPLLKTDDNTCFRLGDQPVQRSAGYANVGVAVILLLNEYTPHPDLPTDVGDKQPARSTNFMQLFADAFATWEKFFFPTQRVIPYLVCTTEQQCTDVSENLGLVLADWSWTSKKLGLQHKVLAAPPGLQTWMSPKGTPVLLTVYDVPFPASVQRNPDLLKPEKRVLGICPPFSRDYVRGTTFYVRYMYNLPMVQLFPMWIKMDTDIWFIAKPPFDIFGEFVERQGSAVFFHTASMDDPQCCFGLQQMVSDYVRQAKGRHACSSGLPVFEKKTDRYYSNFVGGRMDFWSSPEVLDFANYFMEFESGPYQHRWTDQAYFGQALGLFLKKFTDYEADYTSLREKRIFLHGKSRPQISQFQEAFQWPSKWRSFAHPMKWRTELASVAVAHAGCTSHPSKCYQGRDGLDSRVLGPTNVNGGFDTLTREYCAQLCHDAGFKMAGVEFGHECYCGNDVAGTAVAVPATDCSQPCDLDGPIPSKETCGNLFRIDIFDVNCPGRRRNK